MFPRYTGLLKGILMLLPCCDHNMKTLHSLLLLTAAYEQAKRFWLMWVLPQSVLCKFVKPKFRWRYRWRFTHQWLAVVWVIRAVSGVHRNVGVIIAHWVWIRHTHEATLSPPTAPKQQLWGGACFILRFSKTIVTQQACSFHRKSTLVWTTESCVTPK